MRIRSLEIHNVRGIKDVRLNPNAENFVIWGPNGSGKSAVIDAIDFLLTGRMSRLMGEGTAGITLKKHGPHVDTPPSDALVQAVVVLPDGSEVELVRRLEDPGSLQMDPPSESVHTHLDQLSLGQHVLTRREILRFVTSDAGTRAQQMRTLLNLVDLETTRKALVSIKNRTERELQAAAAARDQAVARFAPILGVEQASKSAVLAFANEAREKLGSDPMPTLNREHLKQDLQPPEASDKTSGASVKNVEEVSTSFKGILSPGSGEELRSAVASLAAISTDFRSDPALVAEYRRRQLLKLGLELLGDDERCPLCDTEWPTGTLEERLQNQLVKSSTAHEKVEVLEKARSPILGKLRSLVAALDQLLALARSIDKSDGVPPLDPLENWKENTDKVIQALSASPDALVDQFQSADLTDLPFDDSRVQHLGPVFEALRNRATKMSPEQEAWDVLTRLEEVLALVQDAQQSVFATRTAAVRAQKLHGAFCTAQEQVLQELYAGIEARFSELYRELHGADEDHFTAHLVPKDTGLNFEVDFYGRGSHPPHALHSEGHQDSMGVCLFLTLCERLAGSDVDLVLLDDVVMSVDSEHRRDFARLLKNDFSKRQFIITTHDRTWANQLRAEGLVASRNLVQFYGWNIDTGPDMLTPGEVWDQVERSIKEGNVPAAAATLRRGAEEYCQQVCDRIRAPVRFSTTGRWELGDLAPAAISQLRKLLKDAKKAANSWGQDEVVEGLGEIESTIVQTMQRLQLENWAVNENVHYNAWASFSEPDFRPVVDAMKDFFDAFRCGQCRGQLAVALEGQAPSAVKCSCGSVNWNLVSKG